LVALDLFFTSHFRIINLQWWGFGRFSSRKIRKHLRVIKGEGLKAFKFFRGVRFLDEYKRSFWIDRLHEPAIFVSPSDKLK